jgi:hypothetical protein
MGSLIIATSSSLIRRARLAWLGSTVFVVVAMLFVGFASSATASVEWTSEVQQAPTNLPTNVPAGGRGIVRIIVENRGDTASSGFPTVGFILPQGVTVGAPPPDNFWNCTTLGIPQEVTCTNFLDAFGLGVGPYQYAGFPGSSLYLNVVLDVAPDAQEGVFPLDVTLSGGGGATVTDAHVLRVGAEALPFGPTPGSFTAGTFDQGGGDYTQAGGHPYQATVAFDLNTRFTEPAVTGFAVKSIAGQGALKDAVIDLPPGFVGDPSATPKCQGLGLVQNEVCPASSQIGVARISPPDTTAGTLRMYGVYNVVAPKDAPAQFAFHAPIGNVVLTPVLRSDGDWGISAQVRNTTQIDVVLSSSVTIWGAPADPSHDAQRCARLNSIARACVGFDELGEPQFSSSPASSSAPLRPFLSNPTACTGGPVVTSAHFSEWLAPAAFEVDGDPDLSDPRWASAQTTSPALTGCDRLQFSPQIRVEPTSTAPGSPTGLEFEMRVPQNGNVDGVATAHLRDATVVLPDGMTVNPSSAAGLQACSSSQIGLVSSSPLRFTKLEPSCPSASKLGTVEVETPLLEKPLTGDVFLARQSDNPFDSLLAIYIVVRGPGVLGKLAGHVTADPQTGRLTTTVTDNPQLPFDALRVRLKGGTRAPLTTPSSCGTHIASAALTSWAGHSLAVSDSFSIDCPGTSDGFDPSFLAGSTDVVAGAFSPFVVRIGRDGGKELGRVSVTTPKGVFARVKHVAVCTDAQIASSIGKAGVTTQSVPSCPLASQIGTTTVAAGAGPTPFVPTLPGSSATGRVFLSAPHTNSAFKVPGMGQADYGLAIEVPAVAGPFDLGTVMVRAALYVDPVTAQLTVVSDRLPRILDGIVLDVRDVQVDVDRARFSTTPTSCKELGAVADIRAQDDTQAVRKERYQMSDCAALRYRPRLALRLTGRKRTKTGRHPGIRARVRQSGVGEAAIKRAQVRLPKSLALDPDNAQALCEFADGTKPDPESHCPKGSIIGRARVVSPLLKHPLRGKVFFVKNVRIDKKTGNAIRTLPMLVVALRGEVDVNLRGKSSVKAGRLVNTFKSVPDAPISRFDLKIKGGKNGVLVVTGTSTGNIDICTAPQTALATMDAHNGMRRNLTIRVKTPCRPNALR